MLIAGNLNKNTKIRNRITLRCNTSIMSIPLKLRDIAPETNYQFDEVDMNGLKDGSNLKAAIGVAHASRTEKAGEFSGGKPPSGPKPEKCLVNGIVAPKESGVSK